MTTLTAAAERSDRSADLVVLGSGSLARSTCTALAVAAPADAELNVVVLARDATAARDVCHIASVIARLNGARVAFRPAPPPDPSDPPGTVAPGRLARLFATARPRGVLVCASLQSPWERRTAPSAWTDLMATAGFGLGLPLQAALAHDAARALAATCPEAWLVNACFPDAVNPLLAAADAPVLCGIGNVGLLAAALQTAFDLPDQRRLAVLGHHLHLNPPPHPADEALAWLDGHPLPSVGTLLAGQRAVSRPALNAVTGTTAAAVLLALLTGAELHTSLPGPLGLPGGYPVTVRAGQIGLRLPAGLDRDTAVAHNQRWAALDGVVITDGHVRFGPSVVAALGERRADHPELAELIDGFPADGYATACRRLLDLRERLRARPAGGTTLPPDRLAPQGRP